MKKWWALLAIVLAAAFAAYLPSIDGAFLLDDVNTIRDPLVVDPFGQDLTAWVGSPRPVAALTFALNRAAVDVDPRGWHLTNVAIHLAVVLLAWRFARLTLARAGLSRPEGPALAAAAVFALHPIQTESVAYVTQRAESLASGLFLAALLLLLARDRESAPARRAGLLGAAAAVHVLALGTKPIAATLPAAWLLHAAILPAPGEEELAPIDRVWRRLPAAAPLFAISALFAAWAISSTAGDTYAGFSLPGLPPESYLATQLRVIPTYLRLIAWPAGQCGDWWFPLSQGFLEPWVIAGGALVAALGATAVVVALRFEGVPGDRAAAARVAGFGALFFLLALAPSSSIVPLRDPLAEHRVYLPALGIFVAVAAGAAVLLRSLLPSRAVVAGGILTALVAAAAAAATARRAEVWTTPVAFWFDAAEKAPEKARVLHNLGQAYLEVRQVDRALDAFRRARDRSVDHTISSSSLLRSIVQTLLSNARMRDARAELEAALARAPREPMALALLANVEFVSGRDAECERAAESALEIAPAHAEALKYLGMARLRRGDLPGARQALRRAAATNELDPVIYWQLGMVEEKLRDYAYACAAYARGARQPGNPSIAALAGQSAARLGCR